MTFGSYRPALEPGFVTCPGYLNPTFVQQHSPAGFQCLPAPAWLKIINHLIWCGVLEEGTMKNMEDCGPRWTLILASIKALVNEPKALHFEESSTQTIHLV